MQSHWPLVLLVALVIMLAGCSSAPDGGPSPRPTLSVAPSPSIPSDGVSLRELGFSNGPTERLSLPRGLALTTASDQPNAVTLVISRPSAGELADYLRRTLPAGGFKITEDLGATLTFAGFGWTGSFTGANSSSALVIKPS